MNSARIVDFLLEGGMDPAEFIASLPPHFLDGKFIFGNCNSGVKVYLRGEAESPFIGWIIPYGRRWLAWRIPARINGPGRAPEYDVDLDLPSSATQDEAAEQLLKRIIELGE